LPVPLSLCFLAIVVIVILVAFAIVVVSVVVALYDFAAHLLLLKFARFSRLSNEAMSKLRFLIVRIQLLFLPVSSLTDPFPCFSVFLGKLLPPYTHV